MRCTRSKYCCSPQSCDPDESLPGRRPSPLIHLRSGTCSSSSSGHSLHTVTQCESASPEVDPARRANTRINPRPLECIGSTKTTASTDVCFARVCPYWLDPRSCFGVWAPVCVFTEAGVAEIWLAYHHPATLYVHAGLEALVPVLLPLEIYCSS